MLFLLFISLPNQCSVILVSDVFLQAFSFSFLLFNMGEVSDKLTGGLPLLTLSSRFSITVFFSLATVLVHKHAASKTVMFGCYQLQVPGLFWHWITVPFVIAALCRSTLKGRGFRFTICL